MPLTAVENQLTVVVRECGERTADACAALLAESLPRAMIRRVTGQPFSATLVKSFDAGLAGARPWTLCVDADVLIHPEGLRRFLAEAAHLVDGTFVAQARVFDRLLPAARPAGNHLYRTRLLAEALQLVPHSDSLRPESDTILAMAARGKALRQSRTVIGVHDFEQHLVDIYAKAFLHATKHDMLMPLVEPIWRLLCAADDDYRVALYALRDARSASGQLEVSRDYCRVGATPALAELGLTERQPLAGTSVHTDPADLRLAIARGHNELESRLAELQTVVDGHVFRPEPEPRPAFNQRLARRLKRFLRLAS
jgi:hypothetical protein